MLNYPIGPEQTILVLVSTVFDHTGCLITLSDSNGPILDLVISDFDYILDLVSASFSNLIPDSDKVVLAVRSCKSWLGIFFPFSSTSR